jgi:hypothetical protein
MSGGNPARHVALAAALVLMVAAIAVAEPNGWVRDALRRVNYGPFEDQTVSAAVLSGRAPRTV